MLVATWNVNGFRARWDFFLHWLRARTPDVVGLQELKMEESQFPFAELEREGYHALVHGQKAWNGVAVLSRKPGRVIDRGLPGGAAPESRLIAAEVGGIDFVTIYCPNGKTLEHPDFRWKLEWMDRLQEFVESRLSPMKPTVLCGDFNVCPQGIDSWDEAAFAGTIFHTEEERGRYRKLLGWGFRDLFRELHPGEQAFSWWDYRGGAFYRNQGLRIDLILGAGLGRVESVEIDREFRKKQDGLTASDHAPVLARILDPGA